MSRRTARNTDKEVEASSSSSEEEEAPVKLTKEELRAALREKLKEKRLGRLAPSARDNKIDSLKLKLKELKSDESDKRQKIQNQIDLLERVNENQIDTSASEYPDYGDNGSYGGSIDRGD
jgi:hypothetical protein